jgi:hypothetical protein
LRDGTKNRFPHFLIMLYKMNTIMRARPLLTVIAPRHVPQRQLLIQ